MASTVRQYCGLGNHKDSPGADFGTTRPGTGAP
jgi:hypothetical protein